MVNQLSSHRIFAQAFNEHVTVIEALRAQQSTLELISSRMAAAVLAGNKILWCGNGGSAADAQHLAAEFMGRFRRERQAIPSIALTTDTSILTAIGNDYGFDLVFSRQVQALCKEGDVVVGITTSGSSPNVLEALLTAKKYGAFTVGLTGQQGGEILAIADATICVPSKDTARIQEGHTFCGHMLCDWVELAWCQNQLEAVGQLTG